MAYTSLDAFRRDIMAELMDEYGWDTADAKRALKEYDGAIQRHFKSGERSPASIAESLNYMED